MLLKTWSNMPEEKNNNNRPLGINKTFNFLSPQNKNVSK